MLRNGLTLFHFTTYNHLRSKLKAVHFFLFSKFIFRCREKCLKSPLKHSKMNDTKKVATYFNIYQLVLLEWFMVNNGKAQKSNTQLCAGAVFAKDNINLNQ